MPRSTKSRGVKAQTSTTADAAAVETYAEPETAERPNEDEPTLAELDETAAEIERERATEPAPFAAQYDWDTATWTPRKGNGVRPCTCNRFADPMLACELTTKSRFATGHDARFKGILQRAFRKGQQLEIDFGPEDAASVTDSEGNRVALEGRVVMAADDIARVLAPKLLPHVTHVTRNDKLVRADAAAGTTVPQTAVEARPDEELTDADVDAQVDDAAGVDAQFVEA